MNKLKNRIHDFFLDAVDWWDFWFHDWRDFLDKNTLLVGCFIVSLTGLIVSTILAIKGVKVGNL